MANYAQRNYDAGYAAAQAGLPAQTNTSHPEYSYWIAGYNDYKNSQSTKNDLSGMFKGMSEMFAPMEITVPEFNYDEIIAENKKNTALSRRDTLFSEYLDAAGSATDYINQQISEERANAALLGIDYQLTDEMKQQRIGQYFNTLWGAGAEGELDSLIKEYGNPTGFDGTWPIRRIAETEPEDTSNIPETILMAGSRYSKPLATFTHLATPENANQLAAGTVASIGRLQATDRKVPPWNPVKPTPDKSGKTPIAAAPKMATLSTGKSNFKKTTLLEEDTLG